MSGFVRAFEIIGGLGVFLFGMKVMSEGLQKAAGTKLRAILDSLTGNRFLGVFTGFFVTSAVQSSSATTVMLVSLVNSGLLGLQQAIPVLYGCEIGTTMTAWLVALFGFKIKISAFALPMVGVGFFVRFLNRPKLTQWGEFLIGFGILFLGIEFMKDAVPDAKNSPGLTAWLAQWRVMEGLGVRFLVLLAGALITGVIQSSSAMIAMVQVMASTGLLDFYTAATLVIGANIGTTATAGLASLAANRTAKRVALAHTTFNTFGSVWALLLLPYFLRFVDGLIPGDPMASAAAVTVHIALVHTMFNVINTSLFLPFVKQMVDLQNRILPSREGEVFQLRFIDSAMLNLPTLALAEVRQEVERMTQDVRTMFDHAMATIFDAHPRDIGPRITEMERYESNVDLLEHTLQNFLTRLSQASTTEEQSQEISNLIYNVSDLERVGDHCEIFVKLTARRLNNGLEFSADAIAELTEIAQKVRSFIELIDRHIGDGEKDIMTEARLVESQINRMRKILRKNHVRRLNEGACGVDIGLIFIDMLTSFEKIGDHCFNIAESISGQR